MNEKEGLLCQCQVGKMMKLKCAVKTPESLELMKIEGEAAGKDE